ncbi:MAG: phenylacetate--CoA ligase [Dehalococcoidia bacterium]|nr:phenylacetate--CoA ligase [Dehalococcoidia bacterium]
MAPAIWDLVEIIPRDELERLQVERLKYQLARVKSLVPFYTSLFEGIDPDTIQSISDLASLPFTNKQDLRDTYPFGLFATPMDEVVRIHASSGTTGKPTVVGYTAKDIQMWAGLVARALMLAGVTKDDIVQNAYGYGLFTGGLGVHYGVEKLGAAVVPTSSGNTARQVMLMQDFGTTVLCATPSYALVLAENAAKSGVNLPASPLRIGIFGAEPWSEPMRMEIESRLGITALDIYGLSEIIGPAVAMECVHKTGMHIAEDHFIPEIIDSDTLKPLPLGQTGELVFTCITKEALPLIRYRTHDLARLLTDECLCGRTSVRMEKVLGRNDDMLIIRGVNVFPSQIESVLLAMGRIEPHYQLIVDRGDDHMDKLEVRIESSSAINYHQELEGGIKVNLQNTLGIGCSVTVLPPGEISRSEGKAVRVIDNRHI